MKNINPTLFTSPYSDIPRLDDLCTHRGYFIMKEIWKDIKGYEGYYQVSNLGRVKSLDRLVFTNGYKSKYIKLGKILSNGINGDGYEHVVLYKYGKKLTTKVHRLVAIAFIPNNSNKPEVNHIDSNRKNNKLNNLEWVTKSENIRHGYYFGNITKIGKLNYMKGRIGKKHHSSKPIIQMDMNGNHLCEFESISSVKRKHKSFSIGNISSTCKGKFSHAYGYKWKFKDQL